MILDSSALPNGESSTLLSGMNKPVDLTMSMYWPNHWVQLFSYLFTGCRFWSPSYVTAFISQKLPPLYQLPWALSLRKLAMCLVRHFIIEHEGPTFLNCGALHLNGRFWQLYHTEQGLVPVFGIGRMETVNCSSLFCPVIYKVCLY